jgi:ABC-type sugar transport system ATPase subunit
MTEVALDGLTKTYGPSQVIGPVSLEVQRGELELVSLLGPSG